MINPSILSSVKGATVAIGLVDVGELIPKQVCGTGFIIHENRYIMTARHVINGCFEWLKHYEGINEKVEIVAFNTLTTEKSIQFNVQPLDLFSEHSFAQTNLSKAADGYAGPNDMDIVVGKFLQKQTDLPFLEIRKPEEGMLYKDIAMCGYPSGEQSLDLQKKFSGVRFSPIMQFGKIVGLLSSDNSKQPYSIQTDIIGTGGSSGSPIVSLDDGKVIGIAQQVILASIETNNKTIYGSAKIGLVNGVTNHMFYKLIENVSAFLEKGEKIPTDVSSTHFGKSTTERKMK